MKNPESYDDKYVSSNEMDCEHDWYEGRCLLCNEYPPEPDDFSGAGEDQER